MTESYKEVYSLESAILWAQLVKTQPLVERRRIFKQYIKDTLGLKDAAVAAILKVKKSGAKLNNASSFVSILVKVMKNYCVLNGYSYEKKTSANDMLKEWENYLKEENEYTEALKFANEQTGGII